MKHIKLYEDNASSDKFEDLVNMKLLTRFALGLSNICMGEYGDTYYNPTEYKIAINLGDSNPFGNDESLKSWMQEFIIKDYSKKDLINIEIDSEWVPGHEGWFIFKTDKFVKAK